MKKNQVTVKKSAKKATETALIEALVKKDLEGLAAGDSACCGGPTCITNCS